MAQNKMYHILIIIILCISVLFISGILLPRFFSKQYYKLRSAIPVQKNYFESVSLYTSTEDFKDITPNVLTFDNVINFTKVYQNEVSKTSRIKRKVKRRRLRRETSVFSWNFNLNISQYGNVTPFTPAKSENYSPYKDNYLGMAVYVAGSGQKRSLKQLRSAWDTVGDFLGSLFGVDVSNTQTMKNKSLREKYLVVNDSNQTDSPLTQIRNSNAVPFIEGSGGVMPNARSRESRFFNFLGFGRQTTKNLQPSPNDSFQTTNERAEESIKMNENITLPTTQEIGNIILPLERISVNERHINEANFSTDKSLIKISSNFIHLNQSFPRKSQNIDILPTAFVTKRMKDSELLESVSVIRDVESVGKTTEWHGKENVHVTEESIALQTSILNTHDCDDCETFPGVSIESQKDIESRKEDCEDCVGSTSPLKEFKESPFQFTTSFRNETLENFCMNLVNQIGESKIFHNVTSDKSNSFEENFMSQRNHFLDLFSLLNNLQTNLSNSATDVIEDGFIVDDGQEFKSTNSLTDQKASILFEFLEMFGFEGSGRSLDNPLSSQFNFSDISDIKYMPSVLDCEHYFQNKMNHTMFPRSNLMDINGDTDIELGAVKSTSIFPKYQQKQFQFLTDRLKAIINNSSNKFNSNLNGVNRKNQYNKVSNFELSSILLVPQREPSNQNMRVTEILVPPVNSDSMKSTESESYASKILSTEILKGEKIFNIFGSGSGNIGSQVRSEVSKHLDIEIESSSDDVRLFGVFGSGNDISKIQSPVERLNFFLTGNSIGSGGGRNLYQSYETDYDQQVDLSRANSNGDVLFETEYRYLLHHDATASSQNGNIFDVNIFTGSGAERDIDENDFAANTETSLNRRIFDFYDFGGSTAQRDLNENKHALSETNLFIEDECGKNCADELFESTIKQNCSRVDCRSDSNTFSTDLIKHGLEDSNLKLNKSRFFLETMFLTGSGNGNLIEDNGGPINLLEEDAVTSQQNLLKRGRSPDDLETGSDIFEHTNNTIMQPRTTFSEGFNTKTEPSDYVETFSKPKRYFTRRGKLLDYYTDFVDIQTNQSTFLQPTDSSEAKFNKVNESFYSGKGVMKVGTAHSSDPISVISENRDIFANELSINRSNKNVEHLNIFKQLATNRTDDFTEASFNGILVRPNFHQDTEQIVCKSASQCKYQLNERCVKIGSSSVCGCLTSFVRHKETRKCVAKVSFETTMKFPEENFNEDLRNPESPAFKLKRKESIDTMWFLLGGNLQLVSLVTDIDVTEFSEGSLVVGWNLVLAAENESEADLFKYIHNDLRTAIKNDALLQSASLNMKNASVLNISSNLDPCLQTENYCSENGRCIRNRRFTGGYTCECKHGYFDAVSDKNLPGEICEAFCPVDYCGERGHCEYEENIGRRCLCSGWYFGDRCEISGVVVVATFSASLGVLILVVFIILLCRGRWFNRSNGAVHSQRNRVRAVESACRITDVIAMEEGGGIKVFGFSNIGTPLPTPIIKVTHPTFTDSSIEYENDSTFDTTPSRKGSLSSTGVSNI